jgi:hypothetical protein
MPVLAEPEGYKRIFLDEEPMQYLYQWLSHASPGLLATSLSTFIQFV